MLGLHLILMLILNGPSQATETPQVTIPAVHPCPLRLTVTPAGHMYEGAHLRVSRKTLIEHLQNGCHDGPVTQVTIAASPKTTYGRVKELMDLVNQYGPAGVKVMIENLASSSTGLVIFTEACAFTKTCASFTQISHFPS